MHLPRTVLVLACACHVNGASALAPTALFARVSPAVLVLDTFDERGQRLGSYSVTAIEAELLVSTCDVLETAASLRVGARGVAARIGARDRERNLCLISAPGLDASPIPRQSGAPAVGSQVFALSNALGLGVGISTGVLSGLRGFATGDYLQFSAPISPGSEGGALVDASGQLLGIIDYRRRDGQNVNFALTARAIKEIAARATAAATRLERFDQAMALSRQQQWDALSAVAAAWSDAEPEAADAWRFVIAAAKGRNDDGAELRGWRALHHIDASAAAGIGLGQSLLANGKADEALDLARHLLAAHQEDAACWLLLGQAQQASAQAGEAELSYRRAAELDPWLIEAYARMAALAGARGDGKIAIAIWERLSGLYPNQSGPRLRLVEAYLDAGQPARAWSALGQLADADAALAWYWKGATLVSLGCPEQALLAYRESLERKLAEADLAWAGIGAAMTAMSRYPEAIAAFRSALRAAPDNDERRYQLALSLKDHGDLAEALAISAELLARQAGVAKNWRLRGFALAMLGRTAEAITALEKCLQIDARQPRVWIALARSYQALGRRQDARRAFERLREFDGARAATLYRELILPYEGASR